MEAGFPEGVFQQINIDIPQVENVIAADIVHGITLTGSEITGASVAALAGKHIKKKQYWNSVVPMHLFIY